MYNNCNTMVLDLLDAKHYITQPGLVYITCVIPVYVTLSTIRYFYRLFVAKMCVCMTFIITAFTHQT